MGDVMEIEETALKKSAKRKREQQKLVTPEERESRLKTLNEELCSLIKYFNDVLSVNVSLGLDNFSEISVSGSNASLNAVIATMLEEKTCSYSKLAGEINEKI
ncbi:hypothetical protein RND81_02G167100 [Saponaria officinalis]|uniref:Uncharacterized protein n=1 Tax=Saponaria officinalis TaxID=3572 RepID=A0AAW1MN75_SAPOF